MADSDKIDRQDTSRKMDDMVRDAVNGATAGQMILVQEALNANLTDDVKQLVGSVVEYKEMMMRYTCAIKEIKTKFDVLNTEFNVRYQRNPISSITYRLKETMSIAEKLERRGLPFTIDAIQNNINDVAGIRVICSYLDDIYLIADAFLKQDDITLIKRKDYIAQPKPNGYRSLHLIVSVPVFFANEKREMRAEVQIRTIAMDFWASLEHELKYHKNIPDQKRIVRDLKDCADTIHNTDLRMLRIRNRITDKKPDPSEEDLLYEKFMKLDIKVE